MDHDDRMGLLKTHIDILLDEYRALYALLAIRLGAMEKRIPVTGAALYAVVGSVPALEPIARTLLLLMLPAGAVWFLRTTISHARAKQDVKLRLIEVEQHVNSLVGEELLSFQSRHPSARREVAGRSGQDSVLAVYVGSLGLLAACGFVAASVGLGHTIPLWVYFGALGGTAAMLTWDIVFIQSYRSSPPSSSPS